MRNAKRSVGSASLLEGGGGSNGSFLRAGLIDEISVAICPAVDGARGRPHAFHSNDDEAEARAPLDFRVDFRVSQPTTSWLQHPDQLTWAALEARRAFERTIQLCPQASIWHLFYAGPAPLAVAIGQQLNPTMYPPVQLYEYRHKETPRYKPSIRLGA